MPGFDILCYTTKSILHGAIMSTSLLKPSTLVLWLVQGCGIVEFEAPEEAATAITHLHGSMVGTRTSPPYSHDCRAAAVSERDSLKTIPAVVARVACFTGMVP